MPAGLHPADSVNQLQADLGIPPDSIRSGSALVHQAIRKTLADTPDIFSILNGGMVIVAHKATVDDKNKVIYLQNPSIINGSQTQGELRRFFKKHDGQPDFIPSIRYEVIVTGDANLIADISIARNFQNDVRAISIAGRRGQLDQLESAVQADFPNAKLRKSETDLITDDEDGFLDTEKLIQVTFALMPADMLQSVMNPGDAHSVDALNKSFSYSQKTRCLKLFQRIEEGAEHEEVFDCFLDLAGTAWALYEKWKSHQGFIGTRLRAIERDKRSVVSVPDGIVFPILAAHAAFIRKEKENWQLRLPKAFSDEELIEAAAQAYIEIANSNPQTMGKSKACYTTLHRITSIYARLSKSL